MFLILKGGIFALLSFILFIGYSLKRLKRYFPFVSDWRGAVALVLWIQLVQIAIACITGSHFEANGVSEILWLLLGVLMAAELQGRGVRWLEQGGSES
jgi:hypothetical protein